MSPGNSYFKEDIIRCLIDQVRGKFDGYRIMIPDQPAEFTYRAKGLKDFERTARLQGNAIRNRITRILDSAEEMGQFTLDWKEDINSHPAYQRELAEISKLYTENELFQDAVQSVTREVLQGQDSAKEISDENMDIGVKFLLCELAFLGAAREILGSSVTYIYHRDWPIFRDFIAGKFDGKIRDIDFEIISETE